MPPDMEKVDRLARLTNLTNLLLATPIPLTLDQICTEIEGYPEDGASRRQAFERDKRVLRDEGVPLVTENVVVEDRETTGYRIPPDQFYLPDLGLTEDERGALSLALTTVRIEGDRGAGALLKLGGAAGGSASAFGALPTLPALPDLQQAAATRSPVTFHYGGLVRTVEPYGLLFRHGFWYLRGHDRLRGALRTFRVDRIIGGVSVGEAGSFERPADVDLTADLPGPARELAEEIEAHVLVDAAVVPRVLGDLGDDAVVERHEDGAVTVRLSVTNRDAFRSWVLGFLDRAQVVSPPELRDEIVSWLQAVVAAPLHVPAKRRRGRRG